MKTKNVMLVMAIAAVLLVATIGSASAGCIGVSTGTDYGCGDTVTESCVFNEDMSCPAGERYDPKHGLKVGTNGITIDGNGYAIIGSKCLGACWGAGENNPHKGDCGILNRLHDDVIIKNLEVKNFCNGIVIMGKKDPLEGSVPVNRNILKNCNVHDNGMDNPGEGIGHTQGIGLFMAQYSEVTNNIVYNNTGGVHGSCCDGGNGIKIYGGRCGGRDIGGHNIITHNTIYGNRLSGIFSKKGSKYNYVAYNDVYENGHVYSGYYMGGGIRLECKHTGNWIVEHNNVTDNLGPGIFVRGDDNIIRYNNVCDNKNAGDLTSGVGVSVGYGIYVHMGADRTIITSNVFCDNEYADIGVSTDTSATGDENTCDNCYNYNDASAVPPNCCVYQCAIQANVTIEPETLNLKSKGEWVTAYIELPDGYDVADIDANTVLLDYTIPAVTDTQYGFVTDPESYLMDHDGDGIQERMVKFNRAAVVAYLGTIDYNGGNGNGELVELFVTGEAACTLFVGSDTIRVI